MNQNNVCAIINLAGHEANLHPLTVNRPIAALPFACRYRIIDFMLSGVAEAQIDSVALFIEESGRSIYDHIRNGHEWDLDSAVGGGIFTFSQQRRKLADFLMIDNNERYYENQRLFVNRSSAEYVLIMEGDAIHNVDVEALIKFHKQRDAQVTVAYKSVATEKLQNYKSDEYYTITEEDYLDRVMIAHDSADERHAIDGHVYLVNKEVLFEMFENAESESYLVDIGSLIRSNLQEYKTSMYEYTGFIAIINSLNSYYDANMSMLDTSNFNALFKGKNTIVTRSKSGVPTYYSEDAIVNNAQLATGCIVEGTIRHSLVARKSTVCKDAVVSHSILHSNVFVGEGAVIEYAIVDKGAVIDANAIVKGKKDALIIIKKGQHVVA